MFAIEDLSKSYGKKKVLSHVSLSAAPKEAIGILGVNGSGKSTLLSCIAAAYADDRELVTGYLPQDNPLFDELKPVDNIKMWCGLTKAEIIKALGEPPLDQMGILDFLDTPVRKMSGGMKKRLSLASVLINRPKLMLLDEPFASLDLPAKQDILYYMQQFKSDGGTIIIASHDEDIFHFCDRVFLLKDGALHDTARLKGGSASYADMLRSR